MGLGRPLRVGHWLAENADPFIEQIVRGFDEVGIETVVDLDPRGTSDVFFGCGLLTRELIAEGHDLQVVAAPLFPGEVHPHYRSVFISADDAGLDLLSATREKCIAVNEYRSWSGWHAYLAELEHLGVDSPPDARRGTTGSHRASIRAVQEGRFDFAAIDSSVWTHHRAETQGLTIFATGRDWPAPPVSVRSSVEDDVRDLLATLPALRPATTDDYDEMYEASLRLR
jgi:ABC-type phosphate/phosphonate transport system substrate-binding protein